MAKLISFDENGEAWFDNPQLILANPRRRRRARRNPAGLTTFGYDVVPRESAPSRQGYDISPRAFESPRQAASRMSRKQRAALTKRVKALYRKRFGKGSAYARRKRKMAKQMSLFGATKKRRKSSKRGRNAKGRFVKGHRVHRRRRATRGRSRARFSVRVRGRRRAYTGRSRGRVVRIRINRPRRFRRNSLVGGSAGIRLPFGLALPAVTDMVFAGAGIVAPPMISAQIQAMLPTSITGMAPTVVPWLSDIASVVVPGMLIKRFVGQRQGNAFLIGGSAMLVIKAIKAFAPASMLSTLGLSGYVGSQPLLGAYTDRGRAGAVVARRAGYPSIVSSAPERLSPMNRF